MAFCIPKHLISDFVAKLKSGEITPEKLAKMSSKERHDLFVDMFGEQGGAKANALAESKLLLKNQKAGLERGIKKMLGLKPDAKRDMISRVQRMDKLLDPKLIDKKTGFLNDLANQRLGTEVTMAEASNLTSLSKDVMDKKAKFGEEHIEHGIAIERFSDYYKNLKLQARSMRLREYVNPLMWPKAIYHTAGFQKSLKASIDFSYGLRQGLIAAYAYPKTWAKGFATSFVDGMKALGSDKAEFMMNARTHVRENQLNGNYKKFKVEVGIVEEAHPKSILEKLWVVGPLFRASEVSFASFAREVRLGVFDVLYKKFKDAGLKDSEMEGLGKYVNSLSGRGDLGPLEGAGGALNVFMFSARYARSSIDGVTGYQLNTGMSKAVRLQALKDTGKVWGAIYTSLLVADAIQPGSVEWDPTSSDYGKIRPLVEDASGKIVPGNTRIGVSGGLGAVVTLIARLSPMLAGKKPVVKSTTTGIKYELNDPSVYKGKTGWDLFTDFLGNKKSPFMQSIKMLASQQTYEGDPLTPGNFAFETLSPISIGNIPELYNDPRSANILLASIIDFMGAGTNTYGPEVEWHLKTTKHIKQLGQMFMDEAPKNVKDKEKYKIKKLKEAAKRYNDLYVPWLNRRRNDKVFKALSVEDQWRALRGARREFTNDVYDHYGFSYEQEDKEDLPYFD